MKTRSLGLLLIGALMFLPYATHAAELLFTPATGSYANGKEFVVKVMVKPAAGESVNAADGTIAFDATKLSVTNVSKDGSAFSLWTADPAFSNSAGTIEFSGGTPTAFSTQGTVLSITFKGKALGAAETSFSNGSVLAADGKGTDVYTSGNTGTFTITEAVATPPPTAAATPAPRSAAPIAGGATPFAPVISSPSHDNSEKYYNTPDAEFTWKLSADATGVRTIFSDAEDAVPTEVQEQDATSQTIEGVTDGEWYFFAQFRNDFGWGEVGKKKVLVDTTPPDEFDITLIDSASEGAVPSLAFESNDALAGMDKYEIILGTAVVGSVRAQDHASGMYPVPPQEGGPQTVIVKAYDKAGNVREASAQLNLPAVAKPAPRGSEEENTGGGGGWIERIIAIVFAMIIGALIAWNRFTKKSMAQEKTYVLQEISVIREKNDKIFSAMREEFEQMIQDLDERPQLTPAERNLLEKIKEVLEISEEVLDSSLEDLKKLMRGQ
jgi:hypothetical protein